MSRPAFRFPISGFTLVDLIITVMLLVSLAGVGGFYYEEFKDSQRTGVATNELDALAKAVQAYELTTGTAVDERLVSRYTSRGFPPLHFLVDAGSLPSIPADPWGRDYQIDPSRGVVYSMGPKGPAEGDLSGTDDLKRAYKKEIASGRRSLLTPEQGSLVDDRQAPVITVVEPIGTLDRDNPPVRCTYYDNPGGSIVVSTSESAPKKPKLFIDGEDADDLMAANRGRLSRSISQMVFTTFGRYSEGEHIVVAQVEDGSGNIARRQWKFTVELSRMSVKWLQPLAAQVRGITNISASIYNQGRPIQRWTLFMDSRELVSGTASSPSDGAEVMLVPSGGLPALDTKTLADGAHPLMLRVSSLTGHVEEWQTILNVDNAPPSIRQILNKTSSGQSCLQAQRITTTVPDLGGQASDNFRVRNVTYQYFSVDQTTGSTVGAVMTEPSTAIPATWSPKTNATHREDNPGALFNSANVTFYTIPRPNSSEDFRPVTLPQGLYQVKFQAVDEAGNESTVRTTCFFIDLQKGGIKGQAFFDATAARCNQEFTEDQKHIHGSMATAGLSATQETSGHIEFSILDEGKTPISTWEVIIDDNGTGGQADGQFQKSANPRDWSTSGSFLGKTAGTVFKTGLYLPDSAADSLRRGNDTTALPIAEGPLTARIRYVSDTGTTYTTTTTFLIDNTLPVAAGQYGFAAKQGGSVQPLKEGDILLQSSPTGAPLDGGLEFGGIFTDRPAQGVIREVRWSLLKDGALFPGRNNVSCFPFAGSPCTTNTASFGVVAGLGALDSGSMNISTGVVGGLDGLYTLSLGVTDGAGLTTRPAINFSVDLLPPEVLAIRIFKAGGAAEGILAEIPCSQGPGTLTTCEGQALRFNPIVRDQFPVREVHYWLVPVTDPPTLKSAAVVIPITGTSAFPAIQEQVVVRDTRNSPLRPLPQIYELQVEAVGTHRTDPGPLCTTRVSFRYLTNLAVFAPFDAQSSLVQATLPEDRSAARTWLSSQEQADLASYLYSSFSVGSTQIFDYSGRTSRVGSLLKLTDWLSQNAANGTTDVLVLLDSAPRGAIGATAGTTPALRAFLEGGTGGKKDGNVVVWVGAEPFARQVEFDNGTGGPAVTLETAAATQAAIFGTDLGLDLANTNASQVHFPAGRPLPFLPSLYEYNPFTDFAAAGPGAVPDRWLRCGPHTVGAGAGDWVLERLFTTDNPSAVPPRGNCFVYRNTSSQALFASFQAFGQAGQQSDRTPVPPLAYVIEEFIRNYVVSVRNPVLAAKRIAFNNSNGLLAPIVPSATANPRDVVAYPSFAEGFTNLTTNSVGSQDAQLVGISEDGRTVALLSRDRSKEGGASFLAPATSLFALTDHDLRLQAMARTATGPVLEASLAKRGGSAAFSTLSDLGGVNGGSNLSHRAVFWLNGTSGATTMLTTGGSAAGDSTGPSVGQDGAVVVFSSPNIYDLSDGAVPAAFSNLKTLADGGRGIFRYTTAGGPNAYRNGWVTKSLGESPVCGNPRASADSTFIAFEARQVTYQATLNTLDQVYLAVANPGAGTPWLIGAITQDPAIPAGNLSMAEGAVGVGNFPPLVFESAADYRARRPSAVALTDPTFSAGATSAGNLGFRAIYLFPGSFSENLVLVARGSDADCLNPRISPDGTEVVFESSATQVFAPASTGPPELEHRVVNGSKLNRIYRARVRLLVTSQGSPSSIVERITPEGVDVGFPARPAIAR